MEALLHYRVFEADSNDTTYTRDLYQLDDCSINLLISEQPVEKLGEQFNEQLE